MEKTLQRYYQLYWVSKWMWKEEEKGVKDDFHNSALNNHMLSIKLETITRDKT